MIDLAVFDLDNTILSGDCDIIWGHLLVEEGLVDESIMTTERERMHRDYSARKLDVPVYYSFMFEAFAKLAADEQQKLLKQFVKRASPTVRKDAIDKINWHFSEGHLVMVTTASAQCLSEHLVRSLGINLINATQLKVEDGKYTNQVIGTPNIQEGKLVNLKSTLTALHIDKPVIWAYSDSLNDLPLLELAAPGKAFAITPSAELEAIAIERGWNVENWS